MMQIIKFSILTLIFLSSSYIGILISKRYSNREIELKEFKKILNTIKTKIKFTYQPLTEIFEYTSKNTISAISKIFKNINININTKNMSLANAWIESIDNSNLNINEEDKNIIKALGKVLGKTDVEGQVSEIEVTISFIDNQIQKAELERQKNEKLYKTLGTIIGLTIVIILV